MHCDNAHNRSQFRLNRICLNHALRSNNKKSQLLEIFSPFFMFSLGANGTTTTNRTSNRKDFVSHTSNLSNGMKKSRFHVNTTHTKKLYFDTL